MVAAALGALAACADEPAPTPPPGTVAPTTFEYARSVLDRAPDEVAEDAGELRPTVDRGWGDAGGPAWNDWTSGDEGGPAPYVWSRSERAALEVSATGQADRLLELYLRMPPRPAGGDAASGGAGRELRVYLNGVLLETLAVQPTLELFEIETPGAAWVAGTNVVEFEVDALVELPSGAAVGAGVGPMAFGRAARVRRDADDGALAMAPNTRATYRLEVRGDAQLDLAGRTAGEGTLEVVQRRVDLSTGDADARSETTEFVDAFGGPFETTLDVLAAGGDAVEVELTWHGEGDDEVVVERLGLRERTTRTPPHVVLVSIDTLAARNLELYGYERETAPNLTRFAQEAVVFEDCTTNATWTVPSFMALFSGILPGAHHIDEALLPQNRRPELWEKLTLAPNRWLMAESLLAAGYRTGAFIDNTWITERMGFEEGFEAFDWSAGKIPQEVRTGGIDHVWNLADPWLGDPRDHDRPTFLFLHMFDVHGPYVPVAEHRERFRSDPARDRMVLAGGLVNAFGIVPHYITRGEHPEGPLPTRTSTESIRAAYDGGIHEVDAKLGAVFEELEERGWLDEAVVIITADHGETMGDRELLFGHGVLDPGVSHIPLIVRMPGGAHGGRRVADPVQLIDLYPTVLELAGLEHERSYLRGTSLVPLLEGGEGPEERPILCFEGNVPKQASIQLGRWRLHTVAPQIAPLQVRLTYPFEGRAAMQSAFPSLVERGMTQEVLDEIREMEVEGGLGRYLQAHLPEVDIRLYDIEEDPDELVDLAPQYPRVAERLLRRVIEVHLDTEELRELARNDSGVPELDDEMLDILKSIGYADPDASH